MWNLSHLPLSKVNHLKRWQNETYHAGKKWKRCHLINGFLRLPPNQLLAMTFSKSLARTLIGVSGALGMLFLIAAMTPSQSLIPDDLRQLLRSMSIWQEERPEDKVYIQMDRPFYKPGETLWFTAYVRNGASMKPSRMSDIVHVELLDPKGAVAQSHQLIVRDGKAEGDFQLTTESPGGMYKVKAYTEWMNNEEDPAIFQKDIQVQAVVTPRVKMKLDFVREGYAGGAIVEADVTFESLTNQALANREVKYILQVEGETVKEGNARTDTEGKVRVAAQLPDELNSPDALLIVLMNHQGLMESISRSVPVVLNQIDISFFPEGGDLVEGLPGTVAFKATNAYGEAADIAGVVLNEAGTVISRLKSFHRGMGAFDFQPVAGETYKVALAEPFVTEAIYTIPAAMPRGYTLSVDEIEKNEAKLTIASTETERLSVVGMVRGEAFYIEEFQATPGTTSLSVDLEDFPMGVAQFTLFDSRAIPRAERLAFVNRHRQMKVEISTDKEKYLPREEVKVTIKTLDDRGMPLPAQVSMAVSDDRLRSFADDRSSTILSWMLVESDITGEVEEPRFYFDPEEEKAVAALDYLLMTAGWRRFTWRQLSQQQIPAIAHQPEQTRVKGKILDINGLPVVGARIEAEGITTQTNREGLFEFRNLDLYEPVDLEFSIPGKEQKYIYKVGEYTDDLQIMLGRKKGRILDENGEPLIGATVVIAGTNMGAATNIDGEYDFSVAGMQNGPVTLQVSYVGYETQVIHVNNIQELQTIGDITMPQSQVMLDEVVVVADRQRMIRDNNIQMMAVESVQAKSVGVVARGGRRPRRENRNRGRNQDPMPAMPAPEPAPIEIAVENEEIMDDMAFGGEVLEVAEDIDGDNEVALDLQVEKDEVNFVDAEEPRMPGNANAVPPRPNDFRAVQIQPEAQNLAQVRREIGYPTIAREAAIEGTVVARVLVDERGKVIQSQIVRSAHPVLDQSVEAKLKKLSFTPASQNGQLTQSWVNVPFQFTLEGEMMMANTPVFLGSTAISAAAFYRSREFAAPEYVQRTIPKRRTDFRNTLHWEGDIETDRRGEAEVSFYTSDALTSFHVTVEGIGMDGSIGHEEFKFFSQLPVELDLRVPPLLTAMDTVMIPLTLVNNTDQQAEGPLSIKYPKQLIPLKEMPANIKLRAGESKMILIPCLVDTLICTDSLEVDFRSFGFADAMVIPVRNEARGFPASASFTSEEKSATFHTNLSKAVPGSVKMWFNSFPSVNGEVMEGLEGMLREPNGCFEQTSSTTYPNILALSYMKETDQDNPGIRSRAVNLIAKGYNRLMTFESPSGGFEWFGGDPGHEGLTAYGLMEFVDMSKVYEGVDQKMIDRTVEWLLSRRDGNGGFQRNPRALHYFGLSDDATTSIYIAYALSEAGYTDLEKEVEFAYSTAKESKRPYQVALAANLLLNLGDKTRGKELLSMLVNAQAEAGLWELDQSEKSAPGSTGEALHIECASLAMLGMFKIETYDRMVVEKAATWLRSKRNSYGSFGNTHSTVLALRALIEFAKESKTPGESGEVEIYVDNELVASHQFEAEDKEPILLEGLESSLAYGDQEIEVRYKGVSAPMPYTLSLSYSTDLPTNSEACVVSITPEFTQTSVKLGETLRLDLELRNLTKEGQPTVMAIVGIPAGLSAQPWQLKEMVERKQVDFYEIVGQNLYLYYRQMGPSEVKNLAFDLKGEVPGQYMAQASRAYLYYTDEHKHWAAMPKIEVAE